MLSKNVEYLVSGALALYIVFLTRPAPAMVVNLLSSPIAQVVALAGVIFVGTKSLMVAILLAVSVVLSIPSREHMTNAEKKKLNKKPEEKKKTPSAMKDAGKAATVPAMPTPTVGEPAPGADAVAPKVDSTGSEKFTLQNAAPF
jgi:hypothetical protein